MTRSEFIAAMLTMLAVAGRAVAQTPRADLYDCEDCETAAERDPTSLSWRTTIAPPGEPGERMILRGRVLAPDGVTPASDVVVYAHHTDAEGIYPDRTPETLSSRRHGRLRAWVKTGADGAYEFDTIKPAPYPTMTMPAHVHLYVWEPGRTPYWLDDVVFDGEFGVDDEYRRSRGLRGGSGIVTLRSEDGVLIAERDIVLEIHPE